jgi:hypothetical protein
MFRETVAANCDNQSQGMMGTRTERKANHSHTPSMEIKNAWNFTSTLHICINGVVRKSKIKEAIVQIYRPIRARNNSAILYPIFTNGGYRQNISTFQTFSA